MDSSIFDWNKGVIFPISWTSDENMAILSNILQSISHMENRFAYRSRNNFFMTSDVSCAWIQTGNHSSPFFISDFAIIVHKNSENMLYITSQSLFVRINHIFWYWKQFYIYLLRFTLLYHCYFHKSIISMVKNKIFFTLMSNFVDAEKI